MHPVSDGYTFELWCWNGERVRVRARIERSVRSGVPAVRVGKALAPAGLGTPSGSQRWRCRRLWRRWAVPDGRFARNFRAASSAFRRGDTDDFRTDASGADGTPLSGGRLLSLGAAAVAAGPDDDAEEAAGAAVILTAGSSPRDAYGTTAARTTDAAAAMTGSSRSHDAYGATAARTASTAATLTVSSGAHDTAAARTAAASGSARTRCNCACIRGAVGHDQHGPNGAQPHDQETLAGTSTGIHDRSSPKSLHFISREQRRPSELDMT